MMLLEKNEQWFQLPRQSRGGKNRIGDWGNDGAVDWEAWSLEIMMMSFGPFVLASPTKKYMSMRILFSKYKEVRSGWMDLNF